MSKTTMQLDPNQNRLTISQKGKHCGEIRMTFCVGQAVEIGYEIRHKAEDFLIHHPDHQNGYYDLLLVTPQGKELDFETNII